MEEQTAAVRRMQEYIEKHLSDNITLTALASTSHFSPWYSHRLFTQFLRISPADYIRRLRLSKSALKLRDETCKIIEVAFELGFGSVDGYQRAFLREFGCNPKEYAKAPIPLNLFTPYKAIKSKTREENFMHNTKTVFIQLIEKPARRVIIKRGQTATDYFAYCEEVGCDVWGLLTSIKSISGEPVCLWLPPVYQEPNTSQYVQGVEVSCNYDGIVPDGFDMITLPAAKYLMFQGEPFNEEYYCEAISEVQGSAYRYDPSIIGYCWDNTNPRIQLEPIGTRGYIELHPVSEVVGK
ncbi:MAG: AraC family transcriptional regulator [Lachnospiraceae bacterium]